MKAAHIAAFGGPAAVRVEEAAPRGMQAHEVTVRVEAASVNPLDVKIIAGHMQAVFPVAFPYVPGTDWSGVVAAVGAQVAGLAPGDRVFGRAQPTSGGAFASRLVIAAADVLAVPAAMNFEQAAALPTAFGTARQALFDVGRLQRGQRVLIHAGAGGVGSMAVQQAHHAGAHVIATASQPNLPLVRSLGADEVVDYRAVDFAGLRDIDLVLDTVGGETLERSWSVLGPGGRIATLVDFDIRPRDGHAADFVYFASATPFLPEAVAQFQAGRVQVVIDSVFPLDQVRSAIERVAAGHARGKVVVRMEG